MRSTLAWLTGLAGSFAITFLVFPWSDERISDITVVRDDAFAILDGLLPYRDIPFEYPPLAAPIITVPGIPGDHYRAAFGLWMFVFAVAVLLLVRALARATGGNERLAMAAVVLAPLVTGAMIRNHFDLAPVAITLAALLLIVLDRPVAGFATLGAAVALKFFPIVIAPVALAWLIGRGRRRDALHGTLALGAVLAVALAVMLALSPSGTADALHWQTARPVQVESIPGVVLRVIGGAQSVKTFRSDGLLHPASGVVTGVVLGVGLVAIALLAAGVMRRPGRRELLLASLAAVAAYATFGKVISPQYLVWTVPLAALALAWRRLALFGAVAGATLLTFVEFPSSYTAVTDGRPLAILLVAARDLLLVLAVALSVRELYARAGTSSWSIERARPSSPASMSTALSQGSPDAVSNFTGVIVRKRRIAFSRSTPITD
jgi:uncharacterized membrane protein